MRVLFIGDIVSRPGRNIVIEVLPEILGSGNIDLVIANADNLAGGRGATADILLELKNLGIDYFTGGDHIFWHRGFDEEIENLPVLRPANYPGSAPGIGAAIIDAANGEKALLISVMGRTFLNERLDDPFTSVDEILDKYKDEDLNATLVDFHAEATSEKSALGFYLDGRVDAVIGTHTHVPTCDCRMLPKGTLFVTDVGMTGNIDSVLGVKKEIVIDLYTTARNQKFEWELQGKKAFRSVLVDTEAKTVERIDK